MLNWTCSRKRNLKAMYSFCIPRFSVTCVFGFGYSYCEIYLPLMPYGCANFICADAISCLEKAINLFMDIGRLNMAARYYKVFFFA